MEKKLFILFLCMIPVVCGVAFGIAFNQEYYSQQKFSPKTASWNDPVGMFISEAVVIIERRDMDDPNSTKIKGPNHKLSFGPDDPNDDDFYFVWNEPNDMGLYNDDSLGAAVFHFGEDANTIDVDLNGDLDVSGDTLIGGTLGVTGVTTLSTGIVLNTTRLTADGTTLDGTQYTIYCDTDGGAFTVTLDAAPVDGQSYRIINCGSAGLDLTIDENGNALFGSATTATVSDGEVLILTYETTEGWW